MEFKIDKNVPMPKAANAIQGYCNRSYNIKLAQRVMGDNKWRLWRIK